MAVVTPLNNPGGPEGDTVTVVEQLLTTQYSIGSRASRVAKLGVTYLPFTISSDAGYADLPLALLGAPVDIGALVKTWVTVSWQGQDRDWQAALPGQDHMDPFGFIGVAPQVLYQDKGWRVCVSLN